MSTLYNWIGKEVFVQLYTSDGLALNRISGRVADVSAGVIVHNTIKDLLHVVDIVTPHGGDYISSDGSVNDSWFAVQDCIEVGSFFSN